MPPSLALSLWFLLLVALLYFDPAKERGTSLALWLPSIWMFILGSRLPSQWLGGISTSPPPELIQEGNPLDRNIGIVLILLAIAVLAFRSFPWGSLFARNLALAGLLAYALLSVVWSDFPFVAFKRWFRDLGSYLMMLIVLSDARPFEAVRTLFRRVCYLLIPLSIVFIKYFPDIGKSWDIWTGIAEYSGVATSKNMLGVVCVISGLFFFWDTAERWHSRKEQRTRRIIMVNIAFLAMTLHLLSLANSATSRICLAMGWLVIVAARSKAFKRHPDFLKIAIPAIFVLYLVLAFGFNFNARMASAFGRNPTLTDRTMIWSILLSMHTDPLFGTGYESFWLGHRLMTIRELYGGINEAHDGYLSIYLNLGLVGLSLLVVFLIASYRVIWRRQGPFSSLSSFTLAVWTILLFYNVTESAFGGGLLWLALLPGALNLGGGANERSEDVATVNYVSAVEGSAAFSKETTGLSG